MNSVLSHMKLFGFLIAVFVLSVGLSARELFTIYNFEFEGSAPEAVCFIGAERLNEDGSEVGESIRFYDIDGYRGVMSHVDDGRISSVSEFYLELEQYEIRQTSKGSVVACHPVNDFGATDNFYTFEDSYLPCWNIVSNVRCEDGFLICQSSEERTIRFSRSGFGRGEVFIPGRGAIARLEANVETGAESLSVVPTVCSSYSFLLDSSLGWIPLESEIPKGFADYSSSTKVAVRISNAKGRVLYQDERTVPLFAGECEELSPFLWEFESSSEGETLFVQVTTTVVDAQVRGFDEVVPFVCEIVGELKRVRVGEWEFVCASRRSTVMSLSDDIEFRDFPVVEAMPRPFAAFVAKNLNVRSGLSDYYVCKIIRRDDLGDGCPFSMLSDKCVWPFGFSQNYLLTMMIRSVPERIVGDGVSMGFDYFGRTKAYYEAVASMLEVAGEAGGTLTALELYIMLNPKLETIEDRPELLVLCDAMIEAFDGLSTERLRPLLNACSAVLDTLDICVGRDDIRFQKGLHQMGRIYHSCGEYEKAERVYQLAFGFFEERESRELEEVKKLTKDYSLLLHELGRVTEAEMLEERLNGILPF